MRRLLFCIAILLLFLAGYGQNATQDSIRAFRQRLTTVNTDTARVKLLYNLSYYYQFANLDSSLLIAREAYELAQRINFTKGKARSLGQMAGAFNKMGNYAKSLEYYLIMLKEQEALKNPEDISIAYLNISSVYSSKKETDQALLYAFRSDSMARQYGLSDLLPYIHLNLGNMLTEKGSLDSALLYTQRALDSSLKSKNDVIIGTAYNNLGNIYLKYRRYDSALTHYRMGLPILAANSDYSNLSESYYGMAGAFMALSKFDSALYYARRSYYLASDNGFLQRGMEASRLLSDIFRKNARLDSAYLFQQRYIAMKDSFDNGEKLKELHNLTMNEELRQEELAKEKIALEKERKLKLEWLLVGMLIPLSFLVSAIISKKKVSRRMVELSGIFSLLFLFEYITLLLHPVVTEKSGHSPIIEIIIFVMLAAVLSPAHHKIEHWFVTRLTSRHHHTLKKHEEKQRQKEEPPSA